MIEKHVVLDLISASIEDLNNERDPQNRLQFSPDLVLFGIGSQLDSLEVVNVVVLVEEKVAEVTGVQLGLTATAFNGGVESPLRSVSALADHIGASLASA